jgi:hypothetical protein
LEKRILVWFKRYPSMKEVPDLVSASTLKRFKDKARIRLNILFVAGFSVAFYVSALQGKRAMERGESVTQSNIDWHKEYNSPDNVDLKIPTIKR